MAHAETIDAATTPQGPTGPRTEIGKATASRNATKNGLFAAHDFVREEETEEYAETHAHLRAQLSPEGCLEETFATEIMSATWRLRRCRIVEAGFAIRSTLDPMVLDPMVDHLTSNEQKSVDRARAQAHNILRRCLAELRKLQTERAIRLQLDAEAFPAFTDLKQVNTALKLHDRRRLQARQADGLDTLEGLIAQADKNLCMEVREGNTETEIRSSFCKPAAQLTRTTPRNAACPCNSGIKYKRCCGKEAPPVLSRAA